MNRKTKRMLKKDHRFLNEVMNIIHKYFPELFDMFNDLTDLRHQSYIDYNMKTICVTRFIALICGIKTMNAMTDTFNNDNVINNISNILNMNLSELPHYDTINDVFEKINEQEIRSKMFDNYRYNKKIQLIVDGTGLVTFNYKHCDHCLVDNHKDGTKTYKHYVLEAKMCFGDIVISLDSEFVENPDSSVINIKKQDNEIKAFKRMAKRIKQNFPKLQFIIISIDTGSKHKNYFLLENYHYQKVFFNIIRYYDELDKKKFTYITNIKINDNNIKDVIYLARKRWKIENEGFNEQKNGTFNINHMCSYNYNAMKIHYFFIQFAHTIRQLFDKGRPFVRELKIKIKEVSTTLVLELTSSTADLNLNLGFQLRFAMLII